MAGILSIVANSFAAAARPCDRASKGRSRQLAEAGGSCVMPCISGESSAGGEDAIRMARNTLTTAPASAAGQLAKKEIKHTVQNFTMTLVDECSTKGEGCNRFSRSTG